MIFHLVVLHVVGQNQEKTLSIRILAFEFEFWLCPLLIMADFR